MGGASPCGERIASLRGERNASLRGERNASLRGERNDFQSVGGNRGQRHLWCGRSR
jgi:hypothetical protein